MGKRVAVIVGHPAADSWCGALAESYAAAALAGGHEVRMVHLAKLDFDPSLHEGYRQIQALEPDLLAAQGTVAWAEHVVIAYPIWWGSVPALLKGFLDRILLPGFAFKYRPGRAFPEQLLRGRSAQLLVSMDTPPWYFRWVYRMPGIVQLKKTTLEFCGIAPVKVAAFGPLISSSSAQRASWLVKAARLADGL